MSTYPEEFKALEEENKALTRRAEAAEQDWQAAEAEVARLTEMLKNYGCCPQRLENTKK